MRSVELPCDVDAHRVPKSIPGAGQTVLAVAYFYPPLRGSASIRNLKLLQRLPEYGWRPIVLGVKPAARPDWVEADFLEKEAGPDIEVVRTNCLYPNDLIVRLRDRLGFKKQPLEGSNGSSVNAAGRAGVLGSHVTKRGLAQSIKDFTSSALSTPDSYIGWLPYGVLAGLKVMRRTRVDVIYGVGMPWTSFLVAYVLSLLMRKPLILDFMDPWAADPWKNSRGRFFGSIDRWLERFLVRRADCVIANTNNLARDFIERTGLPPERVRVVTCGYDENQFERQNCREVAIGKHENKPIFQVLHAGTFYRERSPRTFLQALGALILSGRLSKDAVRVDFIGEMNVNDPATLELLADPTLRQVVRLEPWRPQEEVIQRMQESDLLLLVQPGTHLQIPAKLYEYASTGNMILALCDKDGAVDQIMRQEQWGWSVGYNDTSAIATRMLEAIDASRQPSKYFPHQRNGNVSEYSYRSLSHRLAEIFHEKASRANS